MLLQLLLLLVAAFACCLGGEGRRTTPPGQYRTLHCMKQYNVRHLPRQLLLRSRCNRRCRCCMGDIVTGHFFSGMGDKNIVLSFLRQWSISSIACCDW